MFPKLADFHLLGHDIPLGSYGVMAALGFIAAVWTMRRVGTRWGLDGDDILDLAFWTVVGAMVGSRLAYVLINWQEFAHAPMRVFAIWQGGLVFYGGLILALILGAIVIRFKGMPGWRTADAMAPGAALGHALGRIGCFSVGCCFGKPTTAGIAAHFGPSSIAYQQQVAASRLSPLATSTVGLHPVQLYESAGEAIIFLTLLALARRKRFDGALILTYVLFYSVLRFITEMFRGDQTRGYLTRMDTPTINRLLGLPPHAATFLSTSQFVSLLLVPATLATWWYLDRRHRIRTNQFQRDLGQSRTLETSARRGSEKKEKKTEHKSLSKTVTNNLDSKSET
ncbi:MAG: prolipoprotein diacylglyceryl transferase [Deltaproteobacteria bacterium]|nr:prolipoprotein diacylglyceryl transferase [Deltaproteobacteria bacterium]